jgi:hypothetical protein
VIGREDPAIEKPVRLVIVMIVRVVGGVVCGGVGSHG